MRHFTKYQMNDLKVTMGRLAVCALFALSVVPGHAGIRGPDFGGYNATDATPYSFVDISGAGGGASTLSGTDDGLAALTLPFAFTFYGTSYTVVCASSNGALYFVTTPAACAGFNDFVNTDLSVAGPPGDLPAILPLWSDLTFQVGGAGSLFYQTLGSAGSRRFIVQWNNAYPLGSPNQVTFEIVLSEGTNQILFQYQTIGLGSGDPANNGGVATVGIRNGGGVVSGQQTQWSLKSPVLSNGTAILFGTSLPASQTITFGTLGNRTFGDASFSVSATASSGLTVTFTASPPEVCSISGTTVTLTGGGICSITASQAGNGSFAPALSVTQSFTVAGPKTTQTISFAPIGARVAGDAFTLVATASSGLPVTFTVLSGAAVLSGRVLTLTGSGQVVVQASQAGNATYAAAPSVTQSIFASPAGLQLTWKTPAAIPYGTPLSRDQLNASGNAAGSFTYDPPPGTILSLGSHYLLAMFESSDPRFGNGAVGVTLQVTQGTQVITYVPVVNRTTDDALVTLQASASSGLPVVYTLVSGPATIAGNTLKLTGAVGTIVVRLDQPGSTNYLPAQNATISFKVTLGAPAITAVLNGASYQSGPLASNSFAVIFGKNFVATAADSAIVRLGGVPATIVFVSSTQINVLLPPGFPAGPASLLVISSIGQSASMSLQMAAVSPGIFTASANGKGVASSQSMTAQGQTYLVLYGTGVRSGARVVVMIGGTPITPFFAGAQGEFPGLDQINLLVPSGLLGKGSFDVIVSVDGVPANAVQVVL